MKVLLNMAIGVGLLALATRGAGADAHRIAMFIEPRFDGAPLVFDAMTNKTAAGQRISVTRLDFLLSNIALRRADGVWLGLTNWFAYISARDGRTSFELNNLPAGNYDAIRFCVGVPPEINHSDPAQYPPAHPLNPDVNGLHWGWMGGYVFLAMEGLWDDGTSEPDGYSFHIANDPQLMTVQVPLALDLDSDYALELGLDAARIFDAQHRIVLSRDGNATHSRTNDVLAVQLRENIESAFGVGQASRLSPSEKKFETDATPVLRTLIASNATPYDLSISRLFPRPALPKENPLTTEGVLLGATLFLDPRLSINDSQSCASCHQPGGAFDDSGKAVSAGAEGELGTRNTMPLLNLAWKSSFFWDGRAATLREQVLQPMQNPIEMHGDLEHIVGRLKMARVNPRHLARAGQLAGGRWPNAVAGSSLATATNKSELYPVLFARAFGSAEISADRIARALEQFLLTLVSYDSKFDRVLAGSAKFTEEEQRGFELFHTEYDPQRRQFGADCFHCHGGPLFQSQTFANNGLDAEPRDVGRSAVTGKPGDKGKFAVPSLRNVAVTAPYMHDGRFATLDEVIEHYATGVKRSATLDPNLAKHPVAGLPLSDADKQALVAFLKTLTDERFIRANRTLAKNSEGKP